jgi:uncharacterized membrane protein YfcA
VASGVLSGMFGIGGAVVTTHLPSGARRNHLEAIGSTLPAILPSSISGSLRYKLRAPHPWPHLSACLGVRRAGHDRRVVSSCGARQRHWLMIATAVLVGFTAHRTAAR